MVAGPKGRTDECRTAPSWENNAKGRLGGEGSAGSQSAPTSPIHISVSPTLPSRAASGPHTSITIERKDAPRDRGFFVPLSDLHSGHDGPRRLRRGGRP